MPPIVQVSGAKPKKKPNAVRRIMERTESRERRARESSVRVSSATEQQPSLAQTRVAKCPNKNCPMPRVRSGTCETCGAVAEEVDIVAEIQFGEAANGAAVVQGNFLAADQGAVRSSAPDFRRVPGSGNEARERSIREVRGLLQEWTQVLRIPHHLVDSGVLTYKIATNNNFVQGRRKINVAAVCLYSACRRESNNRVMLIDLADLIKTDVFLLGRDYKALVSRFPEIQEQTKPIILEDLIFRFASKLEFYHETNKVAESAVRIAARMRKDNMTHGRRPAGICGAAIIMAARAHNFRRTVREVVYIAKVTMATLQERMEEFANVPSAQMTISQFHNDDFLETNHDPPFFYKQSKEWKDKHTRPRKRKIVDISQGDNQPAIPASASQQEDPSSQQQQQQQQQLTPPVSQQQEPSTIVDKDGFVVPPLPPRVPEQVASADQAVIASATAGLDDQLAALVSEFGDDADQEDEDDEEEFDPSSEMAMAAAQGIVPFPVKKGAQKGNKAADSQGDGDGAPRTKRAKKGRRQLVIDEKWEMDEQNLEREVERHLNDPEMIGASDAVRKDVEDQRAQQAAAAEDADSAPEPCPAPQPSRGDKGEPLYSAYLANSKVSNDPLVYPHEFQGDPEVEFCILGEQEVKVKEIIWANHNKDYMRMVQQRIFASKMSEHGPPKQRRNRAKKPRIGEGQASPAASAEEAAINMMHIRGISTKLDYSRLGQVFDMSKKGPGSTYGSATSVGTHSALASVAGSEAGSDNEEEEDTTPRNTQFAQSTVSTTATAPAPSTTSTAAASTSKTTIAATEDEAADEDDYEANGYDYNEYDDEDAPMEDDFDPFADEYGGDDE